VGHVNRNEKKTVPLLTYIMLRDLLTQKHRALGTLSSKSHATFSFPRDHFLHQSVVYTHNAEGLVNPKVRAKKLLILDTQEHVLKGDTAASFFGE
jgi:hypothetical protein